MISKEDTKTINVLLNGVKNKYNVEILKTNILEIKDTIVLKCKIKKDRHRKLNIKEKNIFYLEKNKSLILFFKRKG